MRNHIGIIFLEGAPRHSYICTTVSGLFSELVFVVGNLNSVSGFVEYANPKAYLVCRKTLVLVFCHETNMFLHPILSFYPSLHSTTCWAIS